MGVVPLPCHGVVTGPPGLHDGHWEVSRGEEGRQDREDGAAGRYCREIDNRRGELDGADGNCHYEDKRTLGVEARLHRYAHEL